MGEKNKIKTKIDENYTKEQFDCDIEMLKYFQAEFMYRHKHFWDIMIKVFTLVVITSLLPFVSEIAGTKLIDSARLYSLCFPVIAFVTAFIGKWVLEDEATKMRAVNKAKYALNREYMIDRYHYYFYNDDVGHKDTDKKITEEEAKAKANRWLAMTLPRKVFMMEMLIVFTSALVAIINLF